MFLILNVFFILALLNRVDAVMLDNVVMEIPTFLWSGSDSVIFFDITIYNMHNHTIPPSSPGYYFYYVEVSLYFLDLVVHTCATLYVCNIRDVIK